MERQLKVMMREVLGGRAASNSGGRERDRNGSRERDYRPGKGERDYRPGKGERVGCLGKWCVSSPNFWVTPQNKIK